MDQQTAEIRQAQWEQIVLEANNSSISKRDWCRQNGISEKAFYYWQRKIRRNALTAAEISPAGMVPAVPSRSNCIEVPVAPATLSAADTVPSLATSPELMLQIGDCRIFVSGSVQEATLATVMKVVRNA